jgi:hypothetical protein
LQLARRERCESVLRGASKCDLQLKDTFRRLCHHFDHIMT